MSPGLCALPTAPRDGPAELRAGEGTRPLLICTGRYDSTLRESYFAFSVAARRRGWNRLLYDGPGQGRPLHKRGLPMRPDWDAVVRRVVDAALKLPGVDRARVTLPGWSFGGYLAMRAAAGEPRLAACVVDPGLMGPPGGLAKVFPTLPPAALEDPLGADPALFAPIVARIEASPPLRWTFV